MRDVDEVMDDTVRLGRVWYWDMDGNPCSLRTWSELFEGPDKILADDVIGDGARRVTTAYLGTNNGTPLPEGEAPWALFGTLVRPRGHEVFTATRGEALLMHARTVAAERHVHG